MRKGTCTPTSTICTRDQVKFVIADEADYLWSRDVLRSRNPNTRCEVLFFRRSPGRWHRRCLPTGFCVTASMCASSCSCTSCYGVVSQGDEDSVRKAVILLSGGLDSATVLAMARADGFACHALSLDYNSATAPSAGGGEARGDGARRCRAQGAAACRWTRSAGRRSPTATSPCRRKAAPASR